MESKLDIQNLRNGCSMQKDTVKNKAAKQNLRIDRLLFVQINLNVETPFTA